MEDKINPIVVEIIRNAVNSAAREMNNCLIKSAFGPGIYEMKDCSVGIFDKDAKLGPVFRTPHISGKSGNLYSNSYRKNRN